MFKVYYKYDRHPKPEIVYAVRKADDGTIDFLMFKYETWGWVDADNYEPWQEEVCIKSSE